MIKYNNNYISKWFLDNSEIKKAYKNGRIVYQKIKQKQRPCFAVTNDISTYSGNQFSFVYDTTLSKWFVLDSNGEYEEYGIFGDSTASTVATYVGKLAIIDGYEWEWDGNAWNNIGAISSSTSTDWVDLFKLELSNVSPSFRYVRVNGDPSYENKYTNFYFSSTPGDTNTRFGYNSCYASRLTYASASFGYLEGETLRYSGGTLISGYTYEFDFGKTYYLCGGNYEFGNIYKQDNYKDFFYILKEVTVEAKPKEYNDIAYTYAKSVSFASIDEMYSYTCPYVGLEAHVGGDNLSYYVFTSANTWDYKKIDNYIRILSPSATAKAFTINSINYDIKEGETIVPLDNNAVMSDFKDRLGLNGIEIKSNAYLEFARENTSYFFFNDNRKDSYGVCSSITIDANELVINSYLFVNLDFLENTSLYERVVKASKMTVSSTFFFSYITSYTDFPYRVIIMCDDLTFNQSYEPFIFYSCTNVDVIFTSVNPPKSTNSFKAPNTFQNSYIYVPTEAFDDYKNCTALANHKDYIKPMSEYDGTIPNV